jgi:hypothetical protein
VYPPPANLVRGYALPYFPHAAYQGFGLEALSSHLFPLESKQQAGSQGNGGRTGQCPKQDRQKAVQPKACKDARPAQEGKENQYRERICPLFWPSFRTPARPEEQKEQYEEYRRHNGSYPPSIFNAWILLYRILKE